MRGSLPILPWLNSLAINFSILGAVSSPPCLFLALGNLLGDKITIVESEDEMKRRSDSQLKDESVREFGYFIRNSIDKVKEDFNKLFNFLSFSFGSFHFMDCHITKLSNNMSPVSNRFSNKLFFISFLNSFIKRVIISSNIQIFESELKDNSCTHDSNAIIPCKVEFLDKLFNLVRKGGVNVKLRFRENVNPVHTTNNNQKIPVAGTAYMNNSLIRINFIVFGFSSHNVSTVSKAKRTENFHTNSIKGGCYV